MDVRAHSPCQFVSSLNRFVIGDPFKLLSLMFKLKEARSIQRDHDVINRWQVAIRHLSPEYGAGSILGLYLETYCLKRRYQIKYPPYFFSAIGGLWAGRILESGQNRAQLQSISLWVTLTKLLSENGLSSRFLFRLQVEIASKIQRFRAPARPIWNG